MGSKNRDKELYLKQYPEVRKWLNECLLCHSKGYKPNLPEKIHPGELAENIRRYFSPLEVNENNHCLTCSLHWK